MDKLSELYEIARKLDKARLGLLVAFAEFLMAQQAAGKKLDNQG